MEGEVRNVLSHTVINFFFLAKTKIKLNHKKFLKITVKVSITCKIDAYTNNEIHGHSYT